MRGKAGWIGLMGSLVAALALGGCIAMLPVAAGSTATLIATKKTPVDLAVSWASGKDCSMLRQVRGESYCVEDAPTPVSAADDPDRPLCYRTLGEVTCYRQPEPQETGRRPIGAPPS